mmetsp:Transcript_34610/g.80941  ORF Transcript_34610/g.80941 Transcript_34610/m.80941 type:complete len:121 (-) Transcript_34610:68-430(-)
MSRSKKERPAEKLPLEILAKVTRRDEDWQKSEILEAVHWFRQFQGLVLGILFGLIPIEGYVGNVAFLIVNSVLPLIFVTSWLGCDEDDFGGRVELIKESMSAAYLSFAFWWVVTYTVTTV